MRGQSYQPIRQQIKLRIDADLIAWFRKHVTSKTGYQTQINDALRAYVERQGNR